MSEKNLFEVRGFHPFGDLIGLKFTKYSSGKSQCSLETTEKLMNPHKTLHGGVLYSMADTGMGAALYSLLKKDESCATVEIKIVYFKAVRDGTLICNTRVIHKGKSIGILESEIENNGTLVSKAYGTFSIFMVKNN